MMAPTRMAAAFMTRLRAVFRRATVGREMREEMARHLDEATERLVRRGLSEAEARDAARREFGNVGALQEVSVPGHRVAAEASGDLAGYALRGPETK